MHSRQRQPARPSRAVALGGRVYEHQLARSLAEKKRTSLPPPLPLPSQYGGQTRLYIALPPSLPPSACLSVSAVRRADGGLSLFAKSTCNFRMFSRRPPSSSFFPFFVCFALAAFLPSSKRDSMAGRGRSTTPARSLARYFLRPVCFFVPLRFAKGTPVKLPVVPTRCAGVFFLRVELESMEL